MECETVILVETMLRSIVVVVVIVIVVVVVGGGGNGAMIYYMFSALCSNAAQFNTLSTLYDITTKIGQFDV